MIRTINGKDYELKITRKGIRQAEREGFNASDVGDKPMLTLTYLWFAAIYGAQPMKFSSATDLLDDYLDSGEEKFTDLLTNLSNEYVELFGLAAE